MENKEGKKRNIDLFNKPYIKNMIVPSMPYMGGKRKLATRLLNVIYDKVGDFDNLYDLFGGGGAMSVAGLLAGHKVIYNEYNIGIYNLMKYIIEGGELPDKWISREEFFKHKEGDDWYSGFIKCVWSFGNSQKEYLFGKDIEDFKRLAHLIVINKDENARQELSKKLEVEIPPMKNRHQFRNFIMVKLKSREGELQQLERLQRLEIYNKSYEEIKIKRNSVIYCDPPYKDTAKYQKTIDYDKFYKWCLENKHPVFISGYEMPKEFIEVAKFKHNTSLGQKSNKETIEKLYWNGKYIKL